MCGIAGWIDFEQPINKDVLNSMCNILVHRGPDGGDTWIEKNGKVGFAHRRLSIIDLSDTAGQPMTDSSGRVCIVFNGEIYNHKALRLELEKEGCVFRTSHSDTECLLIGYLTWGVEKLLEKLIGMFAFVVYDRSQHKIIMCRDRVGIKPLYYARVPDGLIFASEIKALLVHPGLNGELNEDTLSTHLTFRSIPAPNTLFKHIHCLAPSELLIFDSESGHVAKQMTYWDPVANAGSAPGSIDDANERLLELLDESVAYRLESDVPVGLFLSGGLDSALLLQIMAQQLPRMGTYTVGYPGHLKFDESTEAAQLALAVGAEHHAVAVTEADFTGAMIKVSYHQDEPISAPICASVYFLSEKASQTGRKVVLAGEGADELFIGYKTWQQTRDVQKSADRLTKVFGPSLLGLPALLAKARFSYNSKPQEILNRLASRQPLFCGGGLDFGLKAKSELLGVAVGSDDTYARAIEPIRAEYLRSGDPADITQWMSFLDLRFRLPQLMLPRLDKMGMASSIEARVPYLDHRLIEFVFGLPPEWRGSVGKRTKPMLKAAATHYLPNEFVHKRKRGFQAPVTEWKSTLFGKTYLPLLKEFSSKTRLFDSDSIAKLTGSSNDRLYFSLINFVIWYCIFVNNILDLDLSSIALDTKNLNSVR